MKKAWWKESVIYQIYPQSFCDSNGDGIGDIRGIISKLDYVRSLGVDIIWLNPVYESPLDDNGYDISNYRSINPIYGTMDDFEEMLHEIHKRDLKLLMDLVLNHSSDEHEWFVRSRESKNNPYRDYYYWRQGNDGAPPNNWPAIFGGSVWEYDAQTDEYYLHYFSKKQPDLNWENPKLRAEVIDLIRWWLDKGIDGFRFDVISMISKHLDFPQSDTADMGEIFQKYFCNGPKVHEFVRELYEGALKDYDVMTVGEGPGITTEHGNAYTGKDRGELNMVFPLDLMFVDWGPGGKYDFGEVNISDIKKFFREWDQASGDDGWISVFLDNHDFARMVSRFGNDREYRVESAKLLLTMLLTLRGTPTIHYGSEIGMTNVVFDSIEAYRDIESLNFYQDAVRNGMSPEEALSRVHKGGRDNVRTPMQWDDTENAGFGSSQPWLGVNPNYRSINVAQAENEDSSILNYFRKLTALRKSQDVIVYGTFSDLDPDHEKIFHYVRENVGDRLEILLNMSDTQQPCTAPEMPLILCNYDHSENYVLQPWEARVYCA